MLFLREEKTNTLTFGSLDFVVVVVPSLRAVFLVNIDKARNRIVSKYLLRTYYVPSTFLAAQGISVNEQMSSMLMEFNISWGERNNMTNQNM